MQYMNTFLYIFTLCNFLVINHKLMYILPANKWLITAFTICRGVYVCVL